jgi:hypothetical protein
MTIDIIDKFAGNLRRTKGSSYFATIFAFTATCRYSSIIIAKLAWHCWILVATVVILVDFTAVLVGTASIAVFTEITFGQLRS